MPKLGEEKQVAASLVNQSKKSSIKITSNRIDGLEHKRFVIHGKPGAGKTTLAATLSECYPNKPNGKWHKLEDCLWLTADAEGLVGLIERKIEVPQLDLNSILANIDPDDSDEMALVNALDEVIELVREQVASKRVSKVILDTASKLDRPINRFCEAHAPIARSGNKDGFAVWRNVVNMHDWVHQNLNRLPCDVGFIMHSKPRSETQQAQDKARASGLPGINDIVFDFAYNDVSNIYRRDVSLVLVVQRKMEGGYARRYVYAEEFEGFEAKNRFESLIKGAQEPDLKKIFGKIEACLKDK